MPNYLIRYVVESCLEYPNDLTLDYRGHKFLFHFSKKESGAKTLRADVVVQGESAGKAQSAVLSLFPPVLDSLAFATGTPVDLKHCELVLKEETGRTTRNLVFVGERTVGNPIRLWDAAIQEAKHILSVADAPKLPLRWVRYGHQHTLHLDRFMFIWLALEELAGHANIAVPCSRCGNQVLHQGADRHKAYAMVHAARPDISESEFMDRFWRRGRNRVFHGSKEPDSDFMRELAEMTPVVFDAVENSISSQYRLRQRSRSPLPAEHSILFYVFVEWQTTHLDEPFAADWPEEALGQLMAGVEPGVVEDLYSDGSLKLMAIQDSKGW